MSATADPQSQHRFEVHVTSDSHFGWIRTRLSVERTMMSWVRTSVSLIGFGFLPIVSVSPSCSFSNAWARWIMSRAARPQAPRYLGLALIASGIGALVVSIWQYRWILDYLWSPDFKPIAGVKRAPIETPLLGTAVILILIGLFAFFAVLTRAV